ncbi:dihydrodipicolinate reductase [Gonapodya prolifera JEL478]|uniref:Dihydrodipicolinate reductase n=1 Tax=Gonapodya prolifera (strain JEL478) TaxID=1344416 RepID=A0A138ZYM0_GONPJ|nr:dihydrodipicolinate reductase [Gonapodya prolifera JEL478]|eukprot:KXS09365.1 dihydrodipicolinate reductase [Gonapodya prolifera JEL478]
MTVKVMLWGWGLMNPICAKYVLQKGGDVVLVVDRNASRVGKTTDAEVAIAATKPDICILATRSTLKELKDPILTCVSKGVSVVTIAEEATYPITTAKAIVEEIDKVAKANNAAVFGSGYSEWAWVVLPAAVAGAAANVQKVVGLSSYNVNDYGSALCEKHGVGLSAAEFQAKISSQASTAGPSYAWSASEGLANTLGFTVTKMTQEFQPTFADVPVYCDVLKRTLEVGTCTGMAAKATVQTAEGTEIIFSTVGKVYAPGDEDCNDWEIFGDPAKITLKMPVPPTVETTCASAVNRIPQILAGPAGYITSKDLGAIHYIAGKFPEVHRT